MKSILVLIVSLFLTSSFAKKIARVKLLKGKAHYSVGKLKQVPLKKGDWLKEGSVVITKKKSLVRLKFIDDSNVNIGPSSKIKVERFKESEPGIINVVEGKIRAEVSKDYLKMKKNRSKLFVKSKQAVMGIRGTDFLFSAQKTGKTTAVLFEGSVFVAKLPKRDSNNFAKFESIVNKGQRLRSGQFTVVSKDQSKPTIPAKMNKKQFNTLKKNTDFLGTKTSLSKSVVPKGLSQKVVDVSKNDDVKAVATSLDVNSVKLNNDTSISKPNSQVNKDKPMDGAFVHMETGTIVGVGPDAQFNEKLGQWESGNIGKVNNKGEFVPPEGLNINDRGQIVDREGKVVAPTKNGVIVVQDNSKSKPPVRLQPMPEGEQNQPPTYNNNDANLPSSSTGTNTRTKKPITIIINPN
ncbi:MAG: FecR family protein [Bacteriovoracaceae bacterium]|jgi:hypothetical protein|nr:FecR family protein [Bacteriovoracaceae bacterium]